MLWLRGLLLLELTTSTPDALCPPLAEAQAAVQARVGEVRGAYHAEYALVRSDDGRQVLKLVVHDGTRQVLARELPLDGAGCEDAAQAIALVLERHFEAVERPRPSEPAPEPEPFADRPSELPPQVINQLPALDSTPARLPAASRHAWQARGGFIYDRELGVAPSLGVTLFPRALRWTSTLAFGVTLDVAPFIRPIRQRIGEAELAASTLQTSVAFPLVWRHLVWSAAVGPWAQLRLQRAEAPALANERPAYRALAGLGGFVELGWSPAPLWTLSAGLAAGPQLSRATTRFVLQRPAGDRDVVLVPDSWFGQARLLLALGL